MKFLDTIVDEQEENSNLDLTNSQQIPISNRFHELTIRLKDKISEAALIAVLSLIPQIITYFYQCGYLSYYGLPSDFVQMSFQTIIKDTFISILIIVLVILMLGSVGSFTSSTKLSYKGKGFKGLLKSNAILTASVFGFTLCLIVVMLLCIMAADSFSKNYCSILIFACSFMFLLLFVPSVLIFNVSVVIEILNEKLRENSENDKNQSQEQQNENKKSNGDHNYSQSKRKQKKSISSFTMLFLILISVCGFIIGLQYIFSKCGSMVANVKSSYLITTDSKTSQNYVLITKFNDGFIAAQLDEEHSTFSENYKYIDLSNCSNLKMKNIGVIKVLN